MGLPIVDAKSQTVEILPRTPGEIYLYALDCKAVESGAFPVGADHGVHQSYQGTPEITQFVWEGILYKQNNASVGEDPSIVSKNSKDSLTELADNFVANESTHHGRYTFRNQATTSAEKLTEDVISKPRVRQLLPVEFEAFMSHYADAKTKVSTPA